MIRYAGFIFALIVFSLLGVGFWYLSEHLPKPKEVAFSGDYYQALAESRTDGKPVILIFSASWCGPCQYMKKNVYPSAAVSALSDRFHWLLFDVDTPSGKDLAEKYNVRGIPHIQVIDGSENRKGMVVGGRSPGAFADFLKSQL